MCVCVCAQDDHGSLCYLDSSIGHSVTTRRTGLGSLHCMTHNPHNGVVHLGHNNGTHVAFSTSLSFLFFTLRHGDTVESQQPVSSRQDAVPSRTPYRLGRGTRRLGDGHCWDGCPCEDMGHSLCIQVI